jgi:hypothetical protein
LTTKVELADAPDPSVNVSVYVVSTEGNAVGVPVKVTVVWFAYPNTPVANQFGLLLVVPSPVTVVIAYEYVRDSPAGSAGDTVTVCAVGTVAVDV